jgi:hypothetical protein
MVARTCKRYCNVNLIAFYYQVSVRKINCFVLVGMFIYCGWFFKLQSALFDEMFEGCRKMMLAKKPKFMEDISHLFYIMTPTHYFLFYV